MRRILRLHIVFHGLIVRSLIGFFKFTLGDAVFYHGAAIGYAFSGLVVCPGIRCLPHLFDVVSLRPFANIEVGLSSKFSIYRGGHSSFLLES